MKMCLKQSLGSLLMLGAVAVLTGTPASAQDKLMTYGVDIVSDYVSRGQDLYLRTLTRDAKEHTSTHVEPAVQPSVTFFAPNGLSLNLWGSFATGNRADDTVKDFTGLGRDDEIDYTLAFDWSNKLGAFTAALIYYTYTHPCYGCATVTEKLSGIAVQPDAMVKWVMPFAKAISPYVQHYANPLPGASYSVLGMSGGEAVPWALSVGAVHEGVKDVTGKVGYVLGSFTVAANVAYRPNPALVGPYNRDGKYIPDTTKPDVVKDYPPAIFWLTFSYGGEVSAK